MFTSMTKIAVRRYFYLRIMPHIHVRYANILYMLQILVYFTISIDVNVLVVCVQSV